MTALVEVLAANSDPANLGLLAVVWYRLDRRLGKIRTELERDRDGSGPTAAD